MSSTTVSGSAASIESAAEKPAPGSRAADPRPAASTLLDTAASRHRECVRRWGVYVLLTTLAFIQPLARLMLYAARNELHSHILLVPLITGYLLYTQRSPLAVTCRRSAAWAIAFAAIGLLSVGAAIGWHSALGQNDELALRTLGFVALVAAGGFLFLGSKWMARAAFAIAFLIFMVPLPDAAVNWLENASAAASAEAAALYFTAAGTPFVRHDTVFELPGIVVQVGHECSGIRSSWVLFITSVLASYLFLKTRWRRIVLVAFVIPLGILRNGFRILVIGLLCVHVGPQMIDSVVHRRGGPLFFVLSLVPLFLLLWWLRHQERRANVPG